MKNQNLNKNLSRIPGNTALQRSKLICELFQNRPKDLRDKIQQNYHIIENCMPMRGIPNIRDFKVEIGPFHPILKLYGVKKRQFRPVLKTKPYINQSMMRYINHQMIRLNRVRHNPALFWKIAETLLNRSSSFLAQLTHETYPGWYKTMSYGKFWGMIQKYCKIDLKNYEYSITEIPKANGKIRTLGVPKGHWRLYLHGLQIFLQIFLSPYAHPWQHGFLNRKGTGTAWTQIHGETLESPNIFEFDLKDFFPSINLDYLYDLLIQLQIPKKLCERIIEWNRQEPSGPYKPRTWANSLDEANSYRYHKERKWITSHSEYKRWLWFKKIAEKHTPAMKHYDYFHGVAQGSAISPLLSCLILTKDLLCKGTTKVVQYADDGILYDFQMSPEEILKFPRESNIQVNWEKSGWVKKNGEFLRPLKFLGIQWNQTDSPDGILKNATRTPKTFEFDNFDLLRAANQYDANFAEGNNRYSEEVKLYTENPHVNEYLKSNKGIHNMNFEDWFRTKYHDYLMSRIYEGKLDIKKTRKDFTFKLKRWKWDLFFKLKPKQIAQYPINVKKYANIPIDIFNASSFALKSLSLRIKHTLSRKVNNGFGG